MSHSAKMSAQVHKCQSSLFALFVDSCGMELESGAVTRQPPLQYAGPSSHLMRREDRRDEVLLDEGQGVLPFWFPGDGMPL